MALDNYTNLQASIADWMHRNDLTGRIPDFITLAEPRIKALLEMRLQSMTGTLSMVLNQPNMTVPTGLIKVRSLSISGVRPEITYVTPGQYFSMFDTQQSGQPFNYTIIGDQIYFGPLPDSAYTANIAYEAEFVPLSGTNPSNIVLAKWPNVYLWGALKEAANFSRNNAYEASCENNFLAAIDAANRLEWHSGGPMRIRVDTNTP